jgi:hypothetical protein
MKNLAFCFGLIGFFSACGSGKDEQFCKCLEASDQLNAHSVELFSGDISSEQAEKQQQLIKTKKEVCKKYENMTGPEMLERKKECSK